MLIDASPFGMNGSGGGLTPISTAIVETAGTDDEDFATYHVTVFRKFRTDDGHTWCSVSGSIDLPVTIPSGYRPNKRSAIGTIVSHYVGGERTLGTEMITVKANASTIGSTPSDGFGTRLLVGDNIWKVS